MCKLPFAHNRVGLAVLLVGTGIVVTTRPSPYTRMERLADAAWADIDDLWPIRLDLEATARAGDPRASALLAKVLARLGEPAPTLRISRHVSLSPTRERLLAAAAIERNDRAAIRYALSKTWRADFVWTARMLARLESFEGRPVLARVFLAALRHRFPNHRYIDREVARTYLAERRFAEAAHAVRREILLAPSEVRPYWELATVALHAGNFPLAFEAYQDLVRNAPAEPDAPFYACEMARHVKTNDEALRICAHARRLRPNDARIGLEIARNLTLRGQPSEAQALLVADRDRASSRPDSWRALLTWEFENRFYDAAYRVAMDAKPWFPEAPWRLEALDRVRRERRSDDVL